MGRILVRPLAAIVIAAALIGARPAVATDRVDLVLILAVDVSGSVDTERFNIQRNGYASAFRDPSVIEAIAAGAHGAIAVTFVEWSGPGHQQQTIGWTLVRDRPSAAAFADALAGVDRVYADWTSISGAIDFAVRLLAGGAPAAERQVIDISGDGSNNSGRPVTEARDAAVALGITINGLPITTVEPMLDAYYRENVVGGSGAFTETVSSFDSFAAGVRNKLVKEIVGDPGRSIALAQLRGFEGGQR